MVPGEGVESSRVVHFFGFSSRPTEKVGTLWGLLFHTPENHEDSFCRTTFFDELISFIIYLFISCSAS